MVRWQNLSYQYPGLHLHFDDFEAAPGSQWAILGNSGTGKTTLLHLMAGLLRPQVGNIWMGQTEVSALNARAMDTFRGQHIGIIFQQPHFVKSLSVLENILLGNSMAGNAPDKAFATELMERLAIADQANKKTSALSTGQQQRVGIARALINKPSVVLADEPTSALDNTNCEKVLQLLSNQAKTLQANLLLVTHDDRTKQYFENQYLIRANS